MSETKHVDGCSCGDPDCPQHQADLLGDSYALEVLRQDGWTIVGQYSTEKQARVIAADYRAHGEVTRVVLN